MVYILLPIYICSLQLDNLSFFLLNIQSRKDSFTEGRKKEPFTFFFTGLDKIRSCFGAVQVFIACQPLNSLSESGGTHVCLKNQLVVSIQLMANINSKCKVYKVTKLVSGDFFLNSGWCLEWQSVHIYTHVLKFTSKSKNDKAQDLGYWWPCMRRRWENKRKEHIVISK